MSTQELDMIRVASDFIKLTFVFGFYNFRIGVSHASGYVFVDLWVDYWVDVHFEHRSSFFTSVLAGLNDIIKVNLVMNIDEDALLHSEVEFFLHLAIAIEDHLLSIKTSFNCNL